MCLREARKYNYGWGGVKYPEKKWKESSRVWWEEGNGEDGKGKGMKSPLDISEPRLGLSLSTYDEGYETRNFFDSMYRNLPSTLTSFEKIVFLTRSNCFWDSCDEEFEPDLLSYREVCMRLGLDYEGKGEKVRKGWAKACRKIKMGEWGVENEEVIKDGFL
ncbi:hypothetical protein TL16_g09411 [Triparma laevis f. inornata]|uniref:Uncharacterized protein n=2 Tax=Triparma laevis TaxID=1534972 RepID=A0A9W7AI98_9STRA|nr:hypothetical protein TrLO_g1016 [Triparma laevis f. longispina]GMH82876.1 hypothetical protein TL16_g09411 [Triparma laevis f. inornata]